GRITRREKSDSLMVKRCLKKRITMKWSLEMNDNSMKLWYPLLAFVIVFSWVLSPVFAGPNDVTISADPFVQGGVGYIVILTGVPPFKMTSPEPVLIKPYPNPKFPTFQVTVPVGITKFTYTIIDGKGKTWPFAGSVKPPNMKADLSSKSIHVGQSAQLKIIDGTEPFTIYASKNSLVEVKKIDGRTYTITGKAPGICEFNIMCPTQTGYLFFTIEVKGIQATLEPGNIRLGETSIVRTTGGTLPYSILTSPDKMADIVKQDDHTYKLTGKTPVAGSLIVQDSAGFKSNPISFTVKGAPLKFTLTPSAEFLQGTSVVLKVEGGAPPYNVTEMGGKVILEPLSASTWKVAAKEYGGGSLVIKDRLNDWGSVNIKILPAIQPLSYKLSTSTIKVGEKVALFAMNGKPPYTAAPVSGANSVVVDVAITESNGTYVITGKAPGTGQILIRDSANAQVAAAITVTPVQGSLRMTITPQSLTVGQRASLTIEIGRSPFRVEATPPDLVRIAPNLANRQAAPNNFIIQALKPGVARITVTDAAENRSSFAITIQ
ncbi:MAG: hypothetical protein C0407_09140, partial [Desulfobacca sp.]|nr:hypothetical protein [Desulfobacca sp.]